MLNELVTNLKTVAAYGLQTSMQEQYNGCLEAYYHKGKNNAAITGSACGITDSLMFFSSAIAYSYAKHLMQNGGLEIKSMMRVSNGTPWLIFTHLQSTTH